MKNVLLLLCTVVFGAMAAHSQSIKMKISGLTPTAGENILAFENSNSSAVTATNTGFTLGSNTFTEVKFKKAAGGSSNELFKRSLTGSLIAEISFEWYDASNTLFYKMVIRDCAVSGYANLSPECSNCTTLGNEISFVFRKIEWTDVIAGTTVRWDLSQRITY